jgi:hypothetical protein
MVNPSRRHQVGQAGKAFPPVGTLLDQPVRQNDAAAVTGNSQPVFIASSDSYVAPCAAIPWLGRAAGMPPPGHPA